jgi:hypothetical protein
MTNRIVNILTVIAILLMIWALIGLYNETAKADSFGLNAQVGNSTAPAYGLNLQKDFGVGYLNLDDAIVADASSNFTTLSAGFQLIGIHFGVWGGDKFITNNVISGLGTEIGFVVPLNKDFFIRENNRVGRYTGDSNTETSASLGVGLTL